MKIALFSVVDNSEEIGICSIASVLRDNNYEVKLNIFNLYKDKIEPFVEDILAFKPDIIGISTYNNSMPLVFKICKVIKEINNEIKIVLGAATATYYRREILEEAPFVDYIIKGEGEITFLELVKCLESNGYLKTVKGLCYRNNGVIQENDRRELMKNLDDLPYSSRDILVDSKFSLAKISTSRGCTGDCSFCNHFILYDDCQREYRAMSAKRVVDEIVHVMENYNINVFNFTDRSYDDDIPRAKLIAEEIEKMKLDVSYFVNLRVKYFREEENRKLIEKLKKSGLMGVFLGIESGNNEDLELYNKGIVTDESLAFMKFLYENGIEVKAGFINFNPYSTFEGLRKNIEFLEKAAKYDIALSFAYTTSYMAFRGSRLYKRMGEDGLLIEPKVYDSLPMYRFVDQRIEVLVHFIKNYVIPLREQYGSDMIYYVCDYKAMLFYLKKCAKNNQEIIKLIEREEENLYDIISSHIKLNIWLKILLDLAESNWNEDEAKRITNEYFNVEIVETVVNKLRKSNIRFIAKALRLDSNFEKYFKVWPKI